MSTIIGRLVALEARAARPRPAPVDLGEIEEIVEEWRELRRIPRPPSPLSPEVAALTDRQALDLLHRLVPRARAP
jgi:hypothetical protein